MAAKIGRPRDSSIDKRIKVAALELFVAKGAAGASIEGIAERAGVGKMTIYRRYSSRLEILVDAIRDGVGLEFEMKHGSPYDDLLGTLRKMEESMLGSEGSLAMARVFAEERVHPDLVSAYRETVVWPRWHWFRDSLQDGRYEGSIRKDADLSVMVSLLWGAAIGWHVCGFNEDRGGFAEAVMDVLWNGVATRALSAGR